MKIELSGIAKTYQTNNGPLRALQSLNWNAESGRVCGILGPNGSGKTTTIRILLDLLRPDTGEVVIDGALWANRTAKFRRSLGYLPEERGLYKKERVSDVLTYAGVLKGLSRKDAKARTKSYLEAFDLAPFASSPIESLSKGMSQKVQLIMTILPSPRLVILDEPFTGLDPVNVRVVREAIQKLKEDRALVLLCTHRMDEAERLCDDILMLHKGKVALMGTQRSLRESHGSRHIRVSKGLDLKTLRTVAQVLPIGDMLEVVVTPESTANDFLAELAASHFDPSELHITPASLEELYIAAAGAS